MENKSLNSGIYSITNKLTNKFYIGSSTNLHKREISHFSNLRKNNHCNANLQNSYNKYGKDNFVFKVIEFCSTEELEEREQHYLDLYFSGNNPGILYNIFKSAYAVRGINHPLYGKTHTIEAKNKIKEARSKQIIKHSEETRKKIGNSNRGKKLSKECINKIIKSKLGKAPWNKGLTKNNNISLKRVSQNSSTSISQEILTKLIQEYGMGYSLNHLFHKYKIGWRIIRDRLLENGISTRGISEQRKLNFQLMKKGIL